jgi:hypothetical protein
MANAGHYVGVVLFDEHPPPTAVAALTPGQLRRDVLLADGQGRRDAFDDYYQSLTVGLTCSEKPDHLRPSLIHINKLAGKYIWGTL